LKLQKIQARTKAIVWLQATDNRVQKFGVSKKKKLQIKLI